MPKKLIWWRGNSREVDIADAAQAPQAAQAALVAQRPAVDVAALHITVAQQQAELQALEQERRRLEGEAQAWRFETLAQSFHGDAATHLQLLTTLAARGGETGPAFRAYLQVNRAAAAAIAASEAFAQIAGPPAGSATDQLQALAAAHQRDHHVDQAAALTAVAREHPDLYAAHAAAVRVDTTVAAES